MAVTNAVSWRSEGIRYKKNEVFLDVVESVNLLVNSNGTVVRSEVVGALKMRTFLSGMPECKLGLNDKVTELLALARTVCTTAFLKLQKWPQIHGSSSSTRERTLPWEVVTLFLGCFRRLVMCFKDACA